MATPRTGNKPTDSRNSYVDDTSGNVAKNVVIGGGELSVSGLRNALKITTMEVTDTATKMPTTPQTDRNALVIVNFSDTETLYIGSDNTVEANRTIGGSGGHEVGPNESFNLDIKDTIELYGITEAGKTILIKITEVS